MPKRNWKEYPPGSQLMHFDYLELKKRLGKGQVYLKDKWSSDDHQKEKELYEILAIQALEYEVENDLLPI